MIRIGILSDTHGYLHPRIPAFFSPVDEIWHAGDIGDAGVIHELRKIKPVKAVSGNIDGGSIRLEFPEILLFMAEQVRVMVTHIGGYPGRYNPRARRVFEQEKPGLVVCGHSHILKVMYDKKHDFLLINPGAAGIYGMHQSVTAIRLIIDGKNMRDLEVLDIPRK